MTTDDERVPDLLRRGGEVHEVPPARVWEAVRAELDAPAGTARSRARRSAPRPGPTRAAPLLLAAAAGAVLMYAGTQLLPDRASPEGSVVAAGDLGPVAGEGRLGQAEVLDRDDHQVLRVVLDELPDPQDGYLEVWLLRPDVSGLVTLGVLDTADEEFVLPAGLDLTEYPVVDISIEHLDGDPGHGGDSVVRGQVG